METENKALAAALAGVVDSISLGPEIDLREGGEHNPSKSHIYILGFSGGKDSVAAWIYMTKVLGLNVICVFADTAHESPLTYEYLDWLEANTNIVLVRVQATLGQFADEKELAPWKIATRLDLIPEDEWFKEAEHDSRTMLRNGMRKEATLLDAIAAKKFNELGLDSWRDEPLTMERLAILKRRFPSGTRRFCTTFLKLLPQRVWLERFSAKLNPIEASNAIRCSGVRAEESAARAKHKTWTYDRYMGAWMWLPVHKMTHDEVFELHDQHGIKPNPLYKMGCGRVGCFPCINARKGEIKAISGRTDALVQLGQMEDRVAKAVGKPAMSFFSNDRTPERYHSQTCGQSGKTFPVAADVEKWANDTGDSPGQQLMFEEDENEDSHSCSSIYGLCE